MLDSSNRLGLFLPQRMQFIRPGKAFLLPYKSYCRPQLKPVSVGHCGFSCENPFWHPHFAQSSTIPPSLLSPQLTRYPKGMGKVWYCFWIPYRLLGVWVNFKEEPRTQTFDDILFRRDYRASKLNNFKLFKFMGRIIELGLLSLKKINISLRK